MIGHAEMANSAPNKSASMVDSRWFSFAKKSRANRRTDRLVLDVLARFAGRLMVITRMQERIGWLGAVRLRIVKIGW